MVDETLPDASSGRRRSRRRTGENRERLIAAGIVEFGTRGYHGASTSAVGALADVPQPHIYANFRTKQDLFLACLRAAVEALQSEDRLSAGERNLRAAARLVLQAHAAMSESKLQPDLRILVADLRSALGDERVDALVVLAAQELHDNA